jgi:SAM-dependent methyltransferase
MAGDAVSVWDEAAGSFDDEPDHGLADPAVRDAWRVLIREALPPAPARVLDLGCGTGTLSVLVAGLGHRVHGVDLSAAMLARARHKAAGARATFARGDADRPPVRAGSVDVVLCRHVLWALPAPAAAVRRWLGLLAPGGRLVLVEGRWSTGAGLRADEVRAALRPGARVATFRPLPDADYWGRAIDDERYLLVVEPA